MKNIPEHYILQARDRFWAKVDRSGGDKACWPWKAYTNRYGYFGVGSRTDGTRTNLMAHVYSYILSIGPIPEAMELDHLCRNTRCVNPAHLEPVSHATNMARGHWGRKTHCPAGHPYTDGNTSFQVRKDGIRNRICNVCRRAAWAKKPKTDELKRQMAEASRRSYLRRKAAA